MPYSFAEEIKKTPMRKLPALLHDRDPQSQAAEAIRAEIATRKTFWMKLGVIVTIAAVIVAIAVPLLQNWFTVTQTVSAWLSH